MSDNHNLRRVVRMATNDLHHALELTIDQRDRAVQALAGLYSLTVGIAYVPADEVLGEPWAKAVLDD